MTAAAKNLSFPERLVHALTWRAAALRSRALARRPHFVPVLRELHATTGRPTIELARSLLTARRRYGIDAPTFANWMLWEVPQERWSDFVLDRELKAFFASTLDPADRALSRDKVAFAEFDRKHGIAWPATCAVINRREGIPVEGAAVVSNADELWPVLTRLAVDQDLVLKPACGERGSGFFYLSRNGGLRDGRGREMKRRDVADAIFSYRHRLGDFGYLAQPAITPSRAVVELTGIAALVSARVVTTVKSGVPLVVEATVKMPGPGCLTDNFLHGVTGTVVTGLDHETGRLTDAVGLLRRGNRFVIQHAPEHPATGRRIYDMELPRWREAVDLAGRAALVHPDTATLGWDIALAETGCVILDGNPNWGSGGQLCWRKGLRPRLASMFPEHFR